MGRANEETEVDLMDIRCEKGSLKYLNHCEEALLNSELGRRYFPKEGSARNAVLEGLEREICTLLFRTVIV